MSERPIYQTLESSLKDRLTGALESALEGEKGILALNHHSLALLRNSVIESQNGHSPELGDPVSLMQVVLTNFVDLADLGQVLDVRLVENGRRSNSGESVFEFSLKKAPIESEDVIEFPELRFSAEEGPTKVVTREDFLEMADIVQTGQAGSVELLVSVDTKVRVGKEVQKGNRFLEANGFGGVMLVEVGKNSPSALLVAKEGD